VSRVSETTALFAELAAWAAAHGPDPSQHRYGPHPDQHLELRLPVGGGPHPVAVVLHGGFWRVAFTRRNSAAVATALTAEGWATLNVEYRRGHGYLETLEDVAAACAATGTLPAPLDSARTIAVGHSAGGQLALWAAAERLVAAAVSLAGVVDLEAAAAAGLGGDAVVEFLGGLPEDVPERYAAADPLRRLPLGVPTLLVHGTADDRVPLSQSEAFLAAALACGDRCRLLTLRGADHFDPLDPRGDYWPATAAAIAGVLS
jgi:dipeptidyl aminopeptidase/acylaminoacyl peptidase